jgi:hypothetical protein
MLDEHVKIKHNHTLKIISSLTWRCRGPDGVILSIGHDEKNNMLELLMPPHHQRLAYLAHDAQGFSF